MLFESDVLVEIMDRKLRDHYEFMNFDEEVPINRRADRNAWK